MSFSRVLEEKTVGIMIEMYCKKKHPPNRGGMCGKCAALFSYAGERLEKCPFGQNKPVCSQCAVHCYQREKREEIRAVMRYSGPRLLYHSPLLAARYFLRKLRQSWHK